MSKPRFFALFVFALAAASGAQAQQARPARTAARPASTSAAAATPPPAPSRGNAAILHQKTYWRALDLREKQNSPFMARGHELTTLLLTAVQRGELQAYTDDRLTQPIGRRAVYLRTIDEANTPVPMTITEARIACDCDNPVIDTTKYPYLPQQLTRIVLKEDMVMDARRSRYEPRLKAVSIVLPASLDKVLKAEKPVASFRYQDVVRVLRAHPAEARWPNPTNDATTVNYADALELRLFSSLIVKESNLDDAYLVDQEGGDEARALRAGKRLDQAIPAKSDKFQQQH